MLLLFGSLIVHELGHALVARRQGIEVQRIDLFLFGGLTQMSRDADSPGEEFKIAAAGPLATLGFVLRLPGRRPGDRRARTGSSHAAELDGTVAITPVLLSLSWLLFWNVLLLVFNLVPAFPLDGGRIARAIVWRVTGDKRRGTRAAARMGQGFARCPGRARDLWLLLALPAASAGCGWWRSPSCSTSPPAARSRRRRSPSGSRGSRVGGHHGSASRWRSRRRRRSSQALDEYFLRYGWAWFPVVDERRPAASASPAASGCRAAIDGGEGWLTVGRRAGHRARVELARRRGPPADRGPLLGVLRPPGRA